MNAKGQNETTFLKNKLCQLVIDSIHLLGHFCVLLPAQSTLSAPAVVL